MVVRRLIFIIYTQMLVHHVGDESEPSQAAKAGEYIFYLQ
jgi:hypothetical protein